MNKHWDRTTEPKSAPSDFSIITPSFNMLHWLRKASASIADQEGVSVQRIIIDGGSNDGTRDWLAQQQGIISLSEKDDGMYDAINKGLKLSTGSIVAYLNCDEQYLPNALAFVKDSFDKHPNTDIIFGDFLVVDYKGALIAYRKAFAPRRVYIKWDHLYLFTCTMFLRRRVVEDGFLFDSRLRDVGDSDFVLRLLKNGYKARHLKRYLSVFSMTGDNRFIKLDALKEKSAQDPHLRFFSPVKRVVRVARLSEKLFHGAYVQRFPLSYQIYADNDLTSRTEFEFSRGTFIWHLPK